MRLLTILAQVPRRSPMKRLAHQQTDNTLTLAEAALSFNCSAAEITVNRSTIRRQLKGCRANFAASIKNDFAVKVPLVVHWDGKLLQDITGKEHVDRLPVLVSGHGVNKLLGVPKLTSAMKQERTQLLKYAPYCRIGR